MQRWLRRGDPPRAGKHFMIAMSAPPLAMPGMQRAFGVALTALLYFAAGVLALAVYPVGDGLAGIWPASGVAVAGVLIAGPAAALGVLAGDFAVGIHAGFEPFTALTLALGTVGEALIAWLLLTRIRPVDPRLARIRDVAAFIALGAVPAALSCIALRLILLALLGQATPAADQAMGLFVGFLGHGLGVLIVAPVLLTWYVQPRAPQRLIEFAALLLVTAGLDAAAFSATPVAPGSALLYAVAIVVLWAALRFGPRETSTVLLMTGGFATWSAGRASGPFLLASQSEALFSLSLFLLVAAATALFLAAAACERQRYLKRVTESEQAYRTLIEQMAEGVVTIDAAGRLNYVSERFCAICRRAREHLLGTRLSDLVREADRAAVATALQTCTVAGDASCEVALQTGSGISLGVSIAARRLSDAVGRPAGIMAVIADVTERRRAADLAQLHLQQLAHMGRVKSMDEMASAFAHEVAQPLTAITSYTQAAQRFVRAGRGDDPALAEALAGADSEARRAAAIVRRIRGFVQDRTLEIVDVPVDTLVGEALRLSEPEAHQGAIRLRAEICGEHCLVRADPIQIQQVLLNLIRNAIEALAGSSPRERWITLNCAPGATGLVEFAVIDNGPGIAAGELERVFEPFFTTKDDGVGIGLALCRSIVEAHGGSLWAESPADGGAVFRFTLRPAGDEH
ncbi:MAG: hypothetical protein OHK0026_08940 [Rhodocyclaceae bacterium]